MNKLCKNCGYATKKMEDRMYECINTPDCPASSREELDAPPKEVALDFIPNNHIWRDEVTEGNLDQATEIMNEEYANMFGGIPKYSWKNT